MVRTRRTRPLWRACSPTHRSPWWFSSIAPDDDGCGRFDLDAPRGTSYWALDPAVALLEAIADPAASEPVVITQLALSRLRVWRADEVPATRKRLADLTKPAPGLTSEVSSIVGYELPRAWAAALSQDEASGLLYEARFGMGECVALFGAAGLDQTGPAAVPHSGAELAARLPASMRSGISAVGTMGSLLRAPPP